MHSMTNPNLVRENPRVKYSSKIREIFDGEYGTKGPLTRSQASALMLMTHVSVMEYHLRGVAPIALEIARQRLFEAIPDQSSLGEFSEMLDQSLQDEVLRDRKEGLLEALKNAGGLIEE